jgi:hypothetical protein
MFLGKLKRPPLWGIRFSLIPIPLGKSRFFARETVLETANAVPLHNKAYGNDYRNFINPNETMASNGRQAP